MANSGYRIHGVLVEPAAVAGTQPYTVRWNETKRFSDGSPHVVEQVMSGITQASAEALAEAIKAQGVDPDPFCGPVLRPA